MAKPSTDREPTDSERRPWLFALITSVAAAAVAVVWWVAPGSYPYGSGDPTQSGLNHLIERGPAVALLLTSAGLGAVLAVVMLLTGPALVARRIAGVGAALQASFFTFVMCDAGTLAALGYLVAMTAPITIAVVVVLACRRRHRLRVVLVPLFLVVGVVGIVTDAVEPLGRALGDYYAGFLPGPEEDGYYSRTAWSIGMAIAGSCWVWTALAPVLRGYAARHAAGAPSWARAVTIGAALCMVPYGAVRLTWLTPWPLGGGGVDEFVMSHELSLVGRIQGGLFAAACAIGVALTLGLISRWGRVFPGWVPVWGGRPVPVKLAVIPGGVVAGVITLSSSMVLKPPIDGGIADAALMFVAVPLPIWGPLLGAAVFAYWLRRRAEPGTRAADPDLRRPAAIRE